MRIGQFIFVAMAALALGSGSALAADVPAYKDTSLPFEKRAEDLLARMTLEEKCQQVLVHVNPNGRLGLPEMDWWTEANHGISNRGPAGGVTVFPQAIGMAATFDPAIIRQVGDATSTEARARFQTGVRYRGLVLWAPTLNMARDPRWGRVEETYGEDPYLTGRMAVAMVQGMQGDDPKYLKAVGVPKHFAVHSQETARFSTCIDCPEPIIRDYYFPAFRDAFIQGKAMGTMVAFTGINKIPDTANFWLLTQVLRKEWGYTGMVVTDNGGVTQLINGYHYVDTNEEAIVMALNAGVSIIANYENPDFTPQIVHAIKANRLKEEVLDRAVMRNLMVRFRLGDFDPPEQVPYRHIPASAIGSKQNVALALKVAEESIVLLKNEAGPQGFGFGKLLPLDLRRINSIALVGPDATIAPNFGAYSGNPANHAPTLSEALRSVMGDRVEVRTPSWNDLQACVEAAEKSDVVIFAGGLNAQNEREGMDRFSLALPADQQRLLEKLVHANPLTVVVLQGGSVIGMEWIKANVPAALMAWYPGEQGATALVEVLLGKVNPGGRLPLTFYRDSADLPPLGDYDITHGRTYMYNQKPVSYPFGYGLSYTTFDYRDLKVTPPSAGQDAKIRVSLQVANTGPCDGEEVVELYVRQKDAPAALKRPLKRLKGFSRVAVPRGEAREVTMTLDAADLGFWDAEAKNYVTAPGVYEVMVGASAEDVRVRGEVLIK